MSDAHASTEDHDGPELYVIRLKGHLDARWADRFEQMTITLTENGETLLTGPVIDQAALHGLLKKVRDLGLPLVSVGPVRPSLTDAADVKQQKESGNDESMHCRGFREARPVHGTARA